jgi:threonyl-tRNA synthetase
VRLSYRDDSDAYLGDKSTWDMAQKQLKNAVKTAGLDYFEQTGEAAFYGPKIDFMATDAIGREHQVATVQLDFIMPKRFELVYLDENGEKQTPVMIHCALLGSIERFLSVFIEHTAGRFPVWCAPEQLRLIVVKNDDKKLMKFANEIMSKAQAAKIRVALDDSNNSVGKKIRSAETDKVPYSVVLGEKELQENRLLPRSRADLGEVGESTVDELLERLANEAKTRR